VVLAGSGDTLGPNNEISYNGVGVQIGTGTLAATNETTVGNSIGTDPIGTTGLPNGTGIYVQNATGTHIGAPGAKANTISGNLEQVVLANSTVMQNNQIGTTTLGNAAIAPYAGSPGGIITSGVAYDPAAPATEALLTNLAPGSLIGGTQPGMGNTISGSPAGGITLYAKATVQGNKIGVGANGSTPVPNATSGITVGPASNGAMIGGSGTAGAPPTAGIWPSDPIGGNNIANNTIAGVGDFGHGTTILSDSFASNGAGIVGPNNKTPSIVAANLAGFGGTVVLVESEESPGTIVQIYKATSCNTVPQGQTLLQTITLSTPEAVTALSELWPP
jgi:hypothetical protein